MCTNVKAACAGCHHAQCWRLTLHFLHPLHIVKSLPQRIGAEEAAYLCLMQVHISYLEIYNETGYDLLNPDREVQMLEDLPKVAIMEDEESNIHMRNLSIHRANNEEEALNLVKSLHDQRAPTTHLGRCQHC